MLNITYQPGGDAIPDQGTNWVYKTGTDEGREERDCWTHMVTYLIEEMKNILLSLLIMTT